MRYSTTSFLLAVAALSAPLLSSWTLLPVVSAARRPSGGGSRPSPSYSSPSKPSYPTPSSTNSRPSPTLNNNNNRPSVPARPVIRTPGGPISPTTKNNYNPNPSYKPLSPSGAPTLRSGGGGFRSAAKTVAIAAAAGAVLYIAAGYFFYGGRHSGPYCRGTDEDRFASGRCPRGTSSTAHGCKSNIPLCAIPELVRGRWNLGGDAPPVVEVVFDNSVCSVAKALPVAGDDGAVGDAANATANNADGASNSTMATPTNNNATAVKGIEGQSGLDSCLRSIVASGGCDSYSAGNLFLYDDSAGTCGCCSSVQVTTLDSFAAAVYTYRAANDLGGVAPKHCISGSTMFYPDVSGGPDVAHACECGACSVCGNGEARYLDWSGPFVVPDAVGASSFADAAKTRPMYDPVDTCVCDDSFLSAQCAGSEAGFATSGARMASDGHSMSLVISSVAVVFLLHFLRRD